MRAACLCAQSLELCPTLCHSMGSSVHGILQARILRWVACPPPGDLPYPGTEPTCPVSLTLQVGSLLTEPPGKPQEIVCNAVSKGGLGDCRIRADFLLLINTVPGLLFGLFLVFALYCFIFFSSSFSSFSLLPPYYYSFIFITNSASKYSISECESSYVD